MRSSAGRCAFMLLAATVCSLAGCGDNQPTRDVVLYRKILDGEHARLFPPLFDPSADLSLHHALRLADADNETIASSGEDYVQALATKLRDAGTFLPTVSLAPTYSLTHGGSGGFLFGGGLTGTGSSGSTGTTGSSGTTSTSSGGSILFVSGGSTVSHSFSLPVGASANGSLTNISALQAAGATADQRAQLLLDERETILLNVVTSYYNVLTYQAQVEVYEHSVDSKSEKVRDQQARQRLGAVRPLDLAQSQSDLAATQVSLTQARTNGDNARSALARLMGVSAVTGKLTDDFDPPREVPTLAEWQSRAARQRQDLRAAEANLDAARLKVAGAINEYYPSVSINFNYYLYNDPVSSTRWTGGLSGTIPIFSALAIEADVRSAWSVYRQAGLSESQTRRQVTDDVNENFNNLLSSREQIGELHTETDAAQQAVILAERAYTLGSESNLDRLTQQDNLLSSQLSLVSEQFTEKTSYLNLLRASGSLATMLQTPAE